VQVIEDSLRYGVARTLDSAILGYEATGGIAGVKNTVGIHTTALAGAACTIDNLVSYYYEMKADNAPDSGMAMFYNADFAEQLSRAKDGEGRFLLSGAPGSLPDIWSKISRAETNIIPTATNQTDVFLGNFKYAYLALQNNWELLVSEVAYDGTHNAFKEAKVMVRILGWCDVGFGHADYFNVITGVGV
jgi:HK97 family phage major capsid protein